MWVIRCLGGDPGMPAGCGAITRPSAAMLRDLHRAACDVDPADCPECGQPRIAERMTQREYEYARYG